MRIPGLIDPHVHMREPGAAYKEDWSSGTAAALAGGFTQVLAMPNTDPPAVDEASFTLAAQAAQAGARCDFGLFLGGSEDNLLQAQRLVKRCAGLKLYLDQTYGLLRMDAMSLWRAHFNNWSKLRPLVVHAEGRTMAAAILMAVLTDRPLHIAHVATREEILLVRAAKERGFKITCEVTPHHLFLTEVDLPHGWNEVRPRLGTQVDIDALWENLDIIDCFATDHAPHTRSEKTGKNPPPGFPGLETALPLFLTAVHAGRLSLEDLITRMATNPRRIFDIPTQPETWLELDLDHKSTLTSQGMHSKAGWTPFEGKQVFGRVKKVSLRGQPVFKDGAVFATAGSGYSIY